MNSWLDRGLFLLVLYTFMYVLKDGKQPDWQSMYLGAFAIFSVGVIIALTNAGKLK